MFVKLELVELTIDLILVAPDLGDLSVSNHLPQFPTNRQQIPCHLVLISPNRYNQM